MREQRNAKRTIYVLEREALILETINKLGPCSPFDVQESLPSNAELLTVMRTMHTLVDKGLLDRVEVNNQKLYRTKANYRNIKVYLKGNPSAIGR